MAAEEFLGRGSSFLHNGAASFPGALAAPRRNGSCLHCAGTSQAWEHPGEDTALQAWGPAEWQWFQGMGNGTENLTLTSWQCVNLVYTPRRAKNDSMLQEWGDLGWIWGTGPLHPVPAPNTAAALGQQQKQAEIMSCPVLHDAAD